MLAFSLRDGVRMSKLVHLLHCVLIAGLICFAAPVSTPAQEPDPLNDAVRAVITSLPMYGRSKEAQGTDLPADVLKWSYYGEGDAGMLGLPIAEPSTSSFKISWSVSPTDIRGTPEERRIAFQNWGQPCGDKNVNDGTLGPDTCVGSNATAGTQNPNEFADPYMASGTVAAVRLCATVWVQATIAAHPDASHGARTRPEVMQAMEVIARNLAMSAATVVINAVDGGCNEVVKRKQQPDPGQPEPDSLAAYVECPTKTIVISELPSLNCHIMITGWQRIGYPVEVIFPEAQDTFGNHANGIQIAQGPGTEYTENWGSPPKSWGMFVFACPSQQGTGANCYDHLTTPGPTVVPIIVRQRDQQVQLQLELTAVPHPSTGGGNGMLAANLNQVFVNGYYFGSTDVGMQLRWDRATLAGVINGMRQSAAASGVIPVDGIDQIIGLINTGAGDADLAQRVALVKTQVANATSRQCQNNLYLNLIWVLGYYASSAELGAQYGLDLGWLSRQLSELRNTAAMVPLPVQNIDQTLAYLNAGYSQQQIYPSVVALKNELIQQTSYVYQCY